MASWTGDSGLHGEGRTQAAKAAMAKKTTGAEAEGKRHDQVRVNKNVSTNNFALYTCTSKPPLHTG